MLFVILLGDLQQAQKPNVLFCKVMMKERYDNKALELLSQPEAALLQVYAARTMQKA